MNILEKIIVYKELELKVLKHKYSFINELELKDTNEYSLISKISSSKKINIIAEIKKGSPSKGLFAPNLDITAKAKEYELSGASCISVLTDENFFYGSFEYLKLVRDSVNIPLLCKDFIIDIFQIKLAKYHGANVILLIKRILSKEKFINLLNYAKSINLEVFVEVDSIREFQSISNCDFKLCGVNNRDLSDFSIDFNKTKEISSFIKKSNKFLISESGINSVVDVIELRKYNIDGLLVGESLIKDNTSSLLRNLQIFKKRILVKICGITDLNTALYLESLDCDFIGFVFSNSKRQIKIDNAKKIIKKLSSIKIVGVFLNETPEFIYKIFNECRLDYVQVHGNTNLGHLLIPKEKIIPAMVYDKNIPSGYDLVLIDGKTSGSGETYDLEKVFIEKNQNYILAGGLNSSNLEERVNKINPFVVDVSSGVEVNFNKDFNKIQNFINIIGGL